MTQFKKYKLSDITEIIGGGTPRTSVPEYWDGNIPWLSVVDFGGDSKKVYKTDKAITPEGLKNSSTKLLKKGQLIISARGTVGEIAMLGMDMTFNQSCYGLNANEEITTNNFLYYLLKYQLDSIKSVTHGSVFDTITRQTFDQIDVEIPEDLPTQTLIASILSSLDDKIELNRRTNQTLEQIAQTLFKKYFVDDIDPENLPEGWRFGKVGDVSFVQNGYAFKSNDFKDEGEIGIIKIKNINNNVVDIHATQFVLEKTINSLDKKFQINSGDILIAMTGAEVGKIGIVPFKNKSLWLNQRVGKFQEKMFNGNMFTYLLLTSELYQEELQTTAMGSAQPNISGTDIENIKCIVPYEKLILEFGKEVKPMFERICRNLEENFTLSQVRDSLLPKLMSGEIEVKY